MTTEQQIRQAESRWYRLQQQAARHELSARVTAYHQALFVGDLSMRMRLAHEIVQDTKAHHSTVINVGTNTAEIWHTRHTIRRDAKLYERHEHYQSLDSADRIGFKVVEAYVEAKLAHAIAWREIFEGKKTANFDETMLYAHLAPHATRYTQACNQLAAKMVADATSYEAGFNYFKITAEESQPQAYAPQCRMNVEHYLHSANLLERAQHALSIIADPRDIIVPLLSMVYSGAIFIEYQNCRAIRRGNKSNTAATYNQPSIVHTTSYPALIRFFSGKVLL